MLLSSCEQENGGLTQQPLRDSLSRTILSENQNSANFDQYTIYVNALTTDQLSPEVASASQITRSRNRVLLNVHVAKAREEDSGMEPVAAKVGSIVRNLSNQEKGMNIREIVEDTTIYYVGEVPVSNGETLVFELDIIPEGLSAPYQLSYRRQFFTQ
ncbi:MAG: DUF4426 domain-containing protein [Candidatus Eutrophobiaceae bacterium]